MLKKKEKTKKAKNKIQQDKAAVQPPVSDVNNRDTGYDLSDDMWGRTSPKSVPRKSKQTKSAKKQKAENKKQNSSRKRHRPAAEHRHAEPAQPVKKSRKTLRQQRNRRIVISLLLVLVIMVTAVFLSLKVLFIVRDVQVSGSERYTREEIQAFCAIPPEENIFSIDVESLQAALPESFTYIESAKVVRRLPDKISIDITDAVPTYYTVQPDGETFVYTVYSAGFKQLTQQASAPEGLIMIDADITNRQVREALDSIIDILSQGEYPDYTGIIIPTEREIAVVYRGRITVQVGTLNQAEYKIRLAWHVIQDELEGEQYGVIDATRAGSAVFRPLI